jgi:hypothetical protein
MSSGTVPRAKKYTEIPLESHFIAYTPPPLLLNPVPNDWLDGLRMPQPAFPDVAAAQSVPPVTADADAPSCAGLSVGRLHPGPVWIVAWLFV